MMIYEQDGDDAKELAPTDVEAADVEPPVSEEEFAEEVRELVASSAPRVFALVEEYGERVDGRIIAWGMASTMRMSTLRWSASAVACGGATRRRSARSGRIRGAGRSAWCGPAPR